MIAPDRPETAAECTSDDVKDEDLGYITEPMFTQMKVEHLRQACRDRGIINHKGKRMFKAELVKLYLAIVEYIKEKDPDVWKVNETQPREKQRPPPQSMNKHEYARLIHCYISPENMTQLESLTQSQYTQFIVFSAIPLPKGISCFHDSRIPNSVSYTYVV
ncbi:MAG: SAP domain-containing protein [Gloeomargaritales cyanobacterium]